MYGVKTCRGFIFEARIPKSNNGRKNADICFCKLKIRCRYPCLNNETILFQRILFFYSNFINLITGFYEINTFFQLDKSVNRIRFSLL